MKRGDGSGAAAAALESAARSIGTDRVVAGVENAEGNVLFDKFDVATNCEPADPRRAGAEEPSCALVTLAIPSRNANTNTGFLIFRPLEADPTPGIWPLFYGKQAPKSLSMSFARLLRKTKP